MGAVLSAAQGSSRFASWKPFPARLLLAALAAIMVFSALAMLTRPHRTAAAAQASALAITAGQHARDTDLLLYDSVVERVRRGENYYDAAIAEQRARSFPVRPGFAVRTPTLAWIEAGIGPSGLVAASILLLGALALAWWRRFGDEGAGPTQRRFGVALILVGASFTLNPYYHVQHELWAGALMALSLGLHRPGRWFAAVAVAALALAIRELALPFVLLMAALALYRRDWKEAGTWTALVVTYAILMAWHLSIITAHTGPNDPAGPSWLALRGLAGWVSNLVLSSQLHYLPRALGGPLIVLAVLGWAGWKTPAGTTATLLLLGYGTAFMITGRENNFYWGLIVTPVLFAGFAFLPAAVSGLWRAAGPNKAVSASSRATSSE